MTDFSISEELRLIGDNLLRFIDQEVVPLEEKHSSLLLNERNLYDPGGRFVQEVLALRTRVRMKSAAAGYYTMLGPEALGGVGLGSTESVHLFELIAKVYGPERPLIHPVVIPSPFTNGLSPILINMSDKAKEAFLPGIRSGEKTLCFGLSEPGAGSDVFNIRTRATRSGDNWTLNGSKQWITNGPYADYAMIFAVTDPQAFAARSGGITGFLVETRTPGFEVDSVIPVLGHLGGDTAILSLDDVKVPDWCRLGEVDKGLAVALGGISNGRLCMAASCVGFAQWALERAINYAKERQTFGKPIAEHQAVQMLLADCAIDIYAARNMVANCAWRVDSGQRSRKEISMVKAFATEMLNRVMDRAIQVHGAMGLTSEMRLEAGYRFARTMRIPDGTGEIQRQTIARELLAGHVES
ncbi:MAG: acyl-CoA dehydrogenase family protein [Burkholderiaceae bacterium]